MYSPAISRVFRGAVCGVAAFVLFCGALAVGAAQDKDTAGLLRKQAEQALRAGAFAEAEQLYQQQLDANPQDTKARLGLSYAMLKQRYWGGAFDQARRVLEKETTSSRARAIIGMALLGNGDFRSAADAFHSALGWNADDSLAIAGLALIDFYENRLGESVAGLRRAASLDNKEPDFVFALAQAAARKEEFTLAADSFERFLRIAPKTDVDRRERIQGLVDFLRFLGKRGRLYAGEGSQATVPLELVTTRPMLPVRINGSATSQKFVFDTGSGMCVLSEETAKRLGVRPVATGGHARAIGGDGKFQIVYGFLDTLQIGDVTVRNVPVYIRQFHGNSSAVDGYIGTAVIAKYLATIDYAARTFSLSSKRPSAKKGATQLHLPLRSTASGFLSGEVQLDGIPQPLNFIIDTGASISVLSHRLAEREELSKVQEGTRMRIFGAAGVADDVRTLVLPRVLFGEYSQHGINAAVLDLDSINETTGFEQTGILGGNFLYNYRVTFDFKRGILQLESPSGTATPALSPASVAVR